MSDINFERLVSQAETIKNEVAPKANTALRIGTEFLGILEYLKNMGLSSDMIERIKNELKDSFLSATDNDTANGHITFNKGIDSNTVTSIGGYDPLSEDYKREGYSIKVVKGTDGKYYSQLDVYNANIHGKLSAETLEIRETEYIKGEEVITVGGGFKCTRTEDITNGVRCYWNGKDSEGNTRYRSIQIGDLVYCKQFEKDITSKTSDEWEDYGTGAEVSRYFWREVIGVGDDYIDIEYTGYHQVRGDKPMVGDTIVQLGTVNDKSDRNKTIVLSARREGAPCLVMYENVFSWQWGEPSSIISPKEIMLRAEKILIKQQSEKDRTLEQIIKEYNNQFKTIASQLDESFRIWQVDYDAPTKNGSIVAISINDFEPSKDWTSSEYIDHEGDFVITADGVVYEFRLIDSEYEWHIVTDKYLIKAVNEINAINNTLDEMASDSYITKEEMPNLSKIWEKEASDYSTLVNKSTDYNITGEDAYKSFVYSYNTISSLMGKIATALLESNSISINDSSLKELGFSISDNDSNETDTDIWKGLWNRYWSNKTLLDTTIQKIVKNTTDKLAKSLIDMSNDGIITSEEKPELSRLWEAEKGEKKTLVANADTLKLKYPDFSLAFNELNTEILKILGTSDNYTLVKSDWHKKWETYYQEKANLRTAISDAQIDVHKISGKNVIVDADNVLSLRSKGFEIESENLSVNKDTGEVAVRGRITAVLYMAKVTENKLGDDDEIPITTSAFLFGDYAESHTFVLPEITALGDYIEVTCFNYGFNQTPCVRCCLTDRFIVGTQGTAYMLSDAGSAVKIAGLGIYKFFGMKTKVGSKEQGYWAINYVPLVKNNEIEIVSNDDQPPFPLTKYYINKLSEIGTIGSSDLMLNLFDYITTNGTPKCNDGLVSIVSDKYGLHISIPRNDSVKRTHTFKIYIEEDASTYVLFTFTQLGYDEPTPPTPSDYGFVNEDNHIVVNDTYTSLMYVDETDTVISGVTNID